MHESYLTFGISSFTDAISERETIKKHYFYDNGILNLFLFHPETKLLENLVAIRLYKQYGDALYYYNKNVEIDFCVPDERLLVQVSYHITDEATRDREIGALQKVAKLLSAERCMIVTFDQEDTIVLADTNLKVEVVPIYKFLL